MKKYKPLTKSSRQQYIKHLMETSSVEYRVYGVTTGKQWYVATYSTEEIALQHARDAQLKANALIAEYGNDIPQWLNVYDKNMKVVDNFIEYIVEARKGD